MTDIDVTDALVEQIVTIWRRVLPTSAVEPDTDIFDLPVTSLDAVRIRSWIRAELGREIQLHAFVEYPTPRELASAVAAAPEWNGVSTWRDDLAEPDGDEDESSG